MKKLQRVRTRRQLLRATAVSAASIPFFALAKRSASAQQGGNNQGGNNQGGNKQGGNNQGGNNQGGNNQRGNSCFLKSQHQLLSGCGRVTNRYGKNRQARSK